MWNVQEVSQGRATTPILCVHSTLSWYQFTCAFRILIKFEEVVNTYMANELRAASRRRSVGVGRIKLSTLLHAILPRRFFNANLALCVCCRIRFAPQTFKGSRWMVLHQVWRQRCALLGKCSTQVHSSHALPSQVLSHAKIAL